MEWIMLALGVLGVALLNPKVLEYAWSNVVIHARFSCIVGYVG